MKVDFFYNLTFSQFELAINSYRNNSNSIDQLSKTIFTLFTLIIGYCYFLFENELFSPIQYNVISLCFFIIAIVLGFYANQPRVVVYLDPLEIYNLYYELELSDEKYEEDVAEITVTMAEDVKKIRMMCNRKAELLFGMQMVVAIGLFFLCLSIIDFFILQSF